MVRDEEGHPHQQPIHTLSCRPQEPMNLLHPAVITRWRGVLGLWHEPIAMNLKTSAHLSVCFSIYSDNVLSTRWSEKNSHQRHTVRKGLLHYEARKT